MKSKIMLRVRASLVAIILLSLLTEGIYANGEIKGGHLVAPPSYQYQTCIGYSKDLDHYESLIPYSFPEGKNSNHVVGMGFGPTDNVFTWFNDGTVSVGSRKDLDTHVVPKPYALPPGKTYADVIGVSIAGSNNHVFAWYSDGTVSSGTPTDLDFHYAPKKCTSATGKKVTDLVGVGIASTDHVYYWYKDGTFSSGTTDDWDKYTSPAAYTLPGSKTPDDIAGMSIASVNNRTFTWFHGRAVGEAYKPVEEYIDQIVLDLIDSARIPGLTVSASKDGRLVFDKGYGIANYETKQRMHPYHRTRIGSTSKILTTTGLLKLTEEKENFDVNKKVYGPSGVLTYPAYQTDMLKGIKRRRPIVGMDMTSASDRVFTWYVNGKVTSGTPDDLDKYTGPQNYTLPPNQTADNIVGMAIAKFNDHVYVWYEDGSLSSGISTDLDYYFYKPVTKDKNGKVVPVYKSPYGINRILGIAISKDNIVYVWYENGKVSQGSPIDFESYSKPKDFTTPNGSSRYDIRDFGITGTSNRVYAWYSDGKMTCGTSTDLDYFNPAANYSVPASLANVGVQEWKDLYDKMEVRHLLSHTSGLIRSGDVPSAAVMFNKADVDLTYEESHRYTLRMHKLKFEPGTSDAYSNHGLGVSGHILAKQSGVAYEDYIKTKVLAPMGLDKVVPYPLGVNKYYSAAHKNTGTSIKVIGNADSGTSEEGEEIDEESIVGIGYAAGGWAASARDLVRIMLGTDQLTKHSDVLQPATLNLMESRPVPSFAPGRAHGWAIACQNDDCSIKKLAHDGLIAGGNAYMAKFSTGYILNSINVGNINIAVCSNIGSDHTSEFRKLVDMIAERLGATNISPRFDLIYTEPVNNPGTITTNSEAAKVSSTHEETNWNLYPVPSPGVSTVSLMLNQDATISLEVYSWTGIKMESHLARKNLAAGDHQYTIGSYSWPKGLYIVRLIINGKLETKTLSIQ